MFFVWRAHFPGRESRTRVRFNFFEEKKRKKRVCVCLAAATKSKSEFFFFLLSSTFTLFFLPFDGQVKRMTRNQNVSSSGGGGAYILDRSLVPRIRLLAQVCAHG